MFKRAATAFEETATFGSSNFNITGIDQLLRVRGEIVAASYFHLLRVHAAVGRTFLPEDDVWPDEDPIGKRVRLESKMPFDTGKDDTIEIVGIAGDVKYGPLEDEAGVHIYTPYMQFSWWFSSVMVLTNVPPTTLIPDMRGAVAAVDANLPIDNIFTMDERFGVVNQRPRFSTLLLSIFASLALILAAVGIYGVTSQSVSVRTKEIGIRMALGAEPQAVSRLVLGECLKLVTTGVLIGTAGALGLTRILQSQLYEVSATSPAMFIVTAAVLIIVGVVACYFPARRATRIDPLLALHSE